MDNEDWQIVATSEQKANAGNDTLKHLTLTGVKISLEVLGVGASKTVYKAYHNGNTCAAKKINPQCVWVSEDQYFIQKCFRHTQINHKNIVKMLGVSYSESTAQDIDHSYLRKKWSGDEELFLVVELMEYTLPKLLLNDEEMFIPMYVKLSILQDVSAGLEYLHTRNPPLAHGGLVPKNILLSADLVAKIGGFGDSMHRLHHTDIYGHDTIVPSDVCMFGHLAYNVITQKYPRGPHWGWHGVESLHRGNVLAHAACVHYYSELKYIDEITEGPLRHLIQLCLKKNPSMSEVLERITDIKTSKVQLAAWISSYNYAS